ncbi:MAG: fused DSP-PTPase phosphatase/NAD kinase-like protein, partial [Pyrinomonadaceae bacterium]
VPMKRHARPTDEQVERVLAIVNAPENQPAFVYCKRGGDRTGVVVAVYRISQDGWTSATAKAEANRYGMFVTQLEMKDYITQYYCRHAFAGANCVEHRLVNEVATTAAAMTRRIVEEVSAHPVTRAGFRGMKRIFH